MVYEEKPTGKTSITFSYNRTLSPVVGPLANYPCVPGGPWFLLFFNLKFFSKSIFAVLLQMVMHCGLACFFNRPSDHGKFKLR